MSTNTKTEVSLLAKLELKIESSFVEAGKAFAEIRDDRLYLETHKSFKQYCQERWYMSESQVNKLIASATQIKDVIGHSPASGIQQIEKVLSPKALTETGLSTLPKTVQKEVIAKVTENGKVKPTVKEVANAVKLTVLPKEVQKEIVAKATVKGKINANKVEEEFNKKIVSMSPGNKEFNLRREAAIKKGEERVKKEKEANKQINEQAEKERKGKTLVNFREEFGDDWKSLIEYYKKFSYKALAEIAIDVINKSK
jgi:hypothetical protein